MKNKIHLIISGGSSGIGRKIADFYIDKVTKITILDRKKFKSKKINFVHTDLSKTINARKLNNIKNFKFDKIIIINTAVQRSKKKIMQENQNDLNRAFSISVSSPFTIFKPIIFQAIKKRIECKYISIGSVLDSLISPDQSASYHFAKSSALNLVKLFSIFFMSKYFSSVSIKIGFFEKNKKNIKSSKIKKRYLSLTKKSKLFNFDNLVDVINLIINSKNNYLNGSEIVVDHGISNIEQFHLFNKI